MEEQNINANLTQNSLRNPYKKNKKTYLLIGAVVVLIVAVAFILYFLITQIANQKKSQKSPSESTAEGLGENTENTYGTLPENTSLTNPLEKAPEINPADKANPLKDTYKNPFE